MSNSKVWVKTIIIIYTLSLVLCTYAQENILTASEYLDKASARFGEIADYEAKITITQGQKEAASGEEKIEDEKKEVSTGIINYKSPHLLRIDFEDPAEMVMVINNEKLLTYIPEYQVILEQELPAKSARTLASLASSQGLNILRNNYHVAYLTGPDPMPLDKNSEEMVIKLKFTWRDIKEGFKEIIISFDNNNNIRRMKGIQAVTGLIFQFDYTGLILNQGIPDERFEYEPPPYANVYDNFLFGEN